ncbi:MAG: hypothetical protein ACLPWF_29570 [Bryobacteraceae bacterium]
MKPLALWLARLYPRQWRARYGKEFDELLRDTNLTWRDLFDVAISVLEVEMKTTDSPRLVDLASRDVPHGYELESTAQYPREDGGTMLVRNFSRELDFGDSYITLNHWSRGEQPAQTVLVFGKKGEVDGEFRSDETEMLMLRPDGTVQRSEQTVKTWLKSDAIREGLRQRYRNGIAAGLTPDEIHQQLRSAALADSPGV